MIQITPHMRILVAVEPIDFRAGRMCHKRLSSGKFAWWPDGEQPGRTLQACELQVLLMAGDPSHSHTAPAWRPLT
jgi:hypothetical protein